MISNLFFLVTILILQFHDFHVTHTTFYYNDESKSIEITIKVAVEDLERSLENEYSKKLKFEDNQEYEILDNLIKEYFSNHLKFSIDKNSQEYLWVGKEISDNLHDVYLYFEIIFFEFLQHLVDETFVGSLAKKICPMQNLVRQNMSVFGTRKFGASENI